MLYDTIDYSDFIKFTKNGLVIADYTKIRSLLTDRYKQIYGYDIDLSTGTADGQFVEMMSLLINNILLTVNQMYAGLDANTAEGRMLDIIANLSNVQRRQATFSRASLTVQNVSSNSISINTLDFIDKNGTIWTWTSDEPVTFAPNALVSIVAQCSEVGPIQAPAGWITATATNSAFIVTQMSDAIVGQDIETDAHLRSRRNSSLAMSGLTTLEALKASLLNIEGIEDVLIYNNSSETEGLEVKDETIIPLHQVYICIRQNPTVTITERTLGELIYNKMTPGIQTCTMTGTGSGVSKEYVLSVSNIEQHVYWKQCSPTAPSLTITLKKLANYDVNNENAIKQRICDYCNELPISTDLISQELFVQTIYADPKFRGQPTYSVVSVVIGPGQTSFENKDTYYDYATSDITIIYQA